MQTKRDGSSVGMRLTRHTHRRLALLLLAAPAAQGMPLPPLPISAELHANQITAGEQTSADVGMRDDGIFVIVWSSAGADGDGDAIAQRRFTADGTTTFNESVFNQQTVDDQRGPRISMNAGGDFVVVWNSLAAGSTLRARASTSNGSILGNEFQASVITSGSFQTLTASRSDDDSFVLGWTGSSTPFVRHFNAAGTATTGDLEVGLTEAGPFRGQVAAAPDGTFVVAFEAADSQGLGVFAERYNASAVPVGPAIPLNSTLADNQLETRIGSAADGSFAVLWKDNALGLRLRCFDAQGEPVSAEVGVAVDSTGRIAVAPGGQIVVALDSDEIEAREFDRTCQPVTDPFTVNTVLSGDQSSPGIAAGRDRFAVAWESSLVDGDARGIQYRVFRLRSIFADRFESEDFSAWSTTVP